MALVLVVIEEELVAEIGAVVAPHRVDVVAVVDRVVELDQEVRALDAVVVRGAALLPAGPAEPELLEAVGLDARHVASADLFGETPDERLDEIDEVARLIRGHVGARDPSQVSLLELERL